MLGSCSNVSEKPCSWMRWLALATSTFDTGTREFDVKDGSATFRMEEKEREIVL